MPGGAGGSQVNARVLWLAVAVPLASAAQTPPDFSGVYYPINPFGRFTGGLRAGAGQRQGPPPKPTASAPLADGSTGRRPDEPSLKPEYMAKWQQISKTLVAGSSEYDFTAKCLPPGMPAVMSMFYGMEIMQNKDKITFFSELNDALRRVYLDGRKPSQKVSGRSDLRRLLDGALGRRHAGCRYSGDPRRHLHRRNHPTQRRDDGEGAHPLSKPRTLGRSHHGKRSQGAHQDLGDGEDLSKSDAGIGD